MRKKYIMAPGPTEVPAEVLVEAAKPVIHHRTPQYRKILTEVVDGMKYVLGTENNVFVIGASGTGAMEMSVANTVNAGDKVIVASIGVFGDRWEAIAKVYGANVVKIAAEWGTAVKPAELKKALDENPDAVAVFTTLNETSTGVYNDIEAFGKLTVNHKAILVVDGISGIGAQPFYMDKWNVDIIAVGSQKGLMIPPGLAYIAASKKAWAVIENCKSPKFYFDMKKYEKAATKEKMPDTPFTSAVSLVCQQAAALKLIKEEGIEKVWERHEKLSKAVREGIKALGLELFAKENPAVVLCSVVVPEGIDGKALMKKIRDEYGISMAGGQGKMEGKLLRIGTLGYTDRFDAVMGVAAAEMALKDMGAKIEVGKGVKRTMEVLMEEKY
ncbi:MAG TPA: alanine--glyoxylate aminotransferase family protein [Candidatus Goldiibacteriota bacterium]|nr:alanine--glyoxylate aminotransferase family protein [Candidatus Goldiibacteriota bacterium]HPN65479.1 alanine--glyoxylate aminotransferase family protein [Candidatus Goldiibacteriota bacterium]HRQ43595.1 alanine--glyoxylate aminotransferase family protein [Candidatus Goldiibacteriota bacterium]